MDKTPHTWWSTTVYLALWVLVITSAVTLLGIIVICLIAIVTDTDLIKNYLLSPED